MKALQIESWTLSIIERIENHQPVEDARVELKSSWISSDKAARQIAGHANAARGEPILWLIGVDEDHGVIGAQFQELSSWHDKVREQFDGVSPSIITACNVPYKGKTIVALFFDTDRTPYVIKNPVYGQPHGGSVSLEVPWREGNSTRSATRTDLLRILAPLQALPRFEVLKATLVTQFDQKDKKLLDWTLLVDLYAETVDERLIVIPFHKCSATFKVQNGIAEGEFESLTIIKPPRTDEYYQTSDTRHRTVNATKDELLLYSAGKVLLKAFAYTPIKELEGILRASLKDDVSVSIHLVPTNSDRAVLIDLILHACSPETGELQQWCTLQTNGR
jgi:hypothetical protein